MQGTKVIVTKQHIENGARMDEHSCPIALAINGEGSENVNVEVLDKKLCIVKGTEYKEYCLPPSAIHFIVEFDKGNLVNPFNFNIGEEIL